MPGVLPLRAALYVALAGYGVQVIAADNSKQNSDSTLVVNATTPQANSDDESTAVAHIAGSASKSNELIGRTAQSVAVVTQAQISAQAAKTVPQTLRYLAGVTAETSGADSRFDTIYIRGFEADEYLDGLRLPREAYWSRPAWDPFLLSRIEVLKGPSSVLYGQGNPGGVVNLVSKKPEAQPSGQVYFSAGNNQQYGTGFDVTGPLSDDKVWLGRIAGTLFDSKTQVDHTRYQHYDIAPSLTWQPNDKTSLTFLSQFRKDPDSGFFNQQPVVGTLVHNPNGDISSHFYGGQPGLDSYSRKQASVGYQFQHQFNDNITFRQNVRYISSTADYQMVYPFGTLPNSPLVNRYSMNLAEGMTSLALDNQLETRFRTGDVNHTLLVGVDRLHSSVRSNVGYGVAAPLNYLDPDYSTPVSLPDFTNFTHSTLEQTGIYLQDQLKLDNWILSLAGRHDQARNQVTNLVTNNANGLSNSANTGRASLLYHFDNGLAPYISYSSSFVPTSGSDFFGRAFKPTKGKQTEVGLKYEPGNMDALFSLALYNLQQTNVATPDPDHVNYSLQTGEIRSRGIELDGKINITPEWLVLASYSLTAQEVQSANDGTEGKRPPGLARNAANLWTQYALGGRLEGVSVGGGVRYIGSSEANTSNTMKVPAATVYDARIGWQWHQWQLALNAANLTNKTYLAVCQNNGCEYALKRQYVATVGYQW